jgi:hypothetical protein
MSGWETWPFYKDFHLVLCLAIGESWSDVHDIDDSVFPVQMTINYVRVYQTDLAKLGYNIKENKL